MAINTGVTIRGFELWWDISRVSGPYCYLRSSEKVPAPLNYAPLGTDHAQRLIPAWRDKNGIARGLVGEGPWPYAPMDGMGQLSPEEAETVIAARERLTAERFPEPEPKVEPQRAEVPAMAEIAATCEAEGTPMALVSRGRASRTCVECGSLIYGEYCTHCYEA